MVLLAGVPFSVVQLLPSLAETRRRFEARGPVLTQAEFEQVYAGQLAFTHADLRLDTTHLTPEAIAERLLGFL